MLLQCLFFETQWSLLWNSVFNVWRYLNNINWFIMLSVYDDDWYDFNNDDVDLMFIKLQYYQQRWVFDLGSIYKLQNGVYLAQILRRRVH